jgi:hypothetical protein
MERALQTKGGSPLHTCAQLRQILGLRRCYAERAPRRVYSSRDPNLPHQCVRCCAGTLALATGGSVDIDESDEEQMGAGRE